MNQDLINAVASLSSSSAMQQSKKSSDISMDDFLKILAASMSNPSIGSDSSSSGSGGTDYISQLVQFTTLEQLNTLSDTLTTSTLIGQQQQAFQLIGKQVVVTSNGENIAGKVEKVRFQNGYATLVVNGIEYKMSELQEVGE
ncbi:flagellar hook capping FlgD N-terminal domain-containing protein [Enterococcus italicus]|uniref:flagellar hook capping FlgD N-terminal domain-containing protein n=1 Tax=Enterococcus italicus TaxID=246144 RepID=UPI0028A5BB0A|nr:flagellar hook capping FlgD N-terminal domain-containing protein [Enterococcus italicus]